MRSLMRQWGRRIAGWRSISRFGGCCGGRRWSFLIRLRGSCCGGVLRSGLVGCWRGVGGGGGWGGAGGGGGGCLGGWFEADDCGDYGGGGGGWGWGSALGGSAS